MNQSTTLNIKLSVEGAQLVLNALSELPYKHVADLIRNVQDQAQQQIHDQQAIPINIQEGDEE